jgi:hypothetical protein
MAAGKQAWMVVAVVLWAAAVPTRAADELQSKDCGWCVISCPGPVATGVSFEVKIDLRGLAGKAKLAVDLHYLKQDGSFGGMLAWGGGGKDVDRDGPQTRRFTIATLKEDLGTFHAYAFLSPDGEWRNRTKEATGPSLKLQVTEAFLRTLRPADCTFKKSWISLEPPDPAQVIKAGDTFEVRVRYHLDPSENWGDGTQLMVMPLGPWVDNPDGTYTKSRQHVGYPGLGTQVVKVAPGPGELVLKFRPSAVHRYNGLLLLGTFRGGDGKNWPWEVRAPGPRFTFEDKLYQLENSQPGGLFTYEEPVKLRLVFKAGAVKGETRKLTYRLVDAQGAEAGSGELPFVVGGRDEAVEFTPVVKQRGTFLLEGSVEGWGTREVVFARIPDVARLTGGGRTPFAATNLRSPAECQVARRLGFTACRQFMDWRTVQPGRDAWTFTGWDRILDTNRQHGIEPWLCLYAPPAWVQRGAAANVGYEPFGFDEAAWRDSVAVMTRRWQDRISGWEWLNEIVPGNKSTQPVEDYVRFCAIGTETAKQIKPTLRVLLAGGLWPRSFRNDCLKAGVGRWVDELPVHYSDMGGVLEARDDLDAAGCRQVAVSDNESGSGLSTWQMPTREMLRIRTQSQWVLDRWPDELVAGAERVTCFGGWVDPCGNWSYLLDEHTPRPMAATIAVLASKVGGARPLGKFYLPAHGVCHLFAQDGRAVLLASSSAGGGETVEINVGREQVVVTDCQGNETVQRAPGGKLRLPLSAMRVFIEGGDLDVLKSYCAVAVGGGQQVVELPKQTVLTGSAAKVSVAVRNLYDRVLAGQVSLAPPPGWPAGAPLSFAVGPGQRALLDVPLPLPPTAATGEFALKAEFAFAGGQLPVVTKPFGVSLISRDMVGNLLRNSGFEVAGASDATPASWSLGGGARRVPSDGGLGLGGHVLKFANAANYEHATQTITPPPGQTYLYSAWVWNQDMTAGSNITHELADGTKKEFYTPAVFMSGNSSPSWHLYTCRTNAPQSLTRMAFTPVVKGAGWALYDNLRVTRYEGSNYAAECHRVKTPPSIAGRFDGWQRTCPIPLLCDNQVSLLDHAYRWTPANCSGVAWLNWDAKALYVAVEVVDDVHHARTTGEQTLDGDSVALAIAPAGRTPGRADQAFVYYLGSAPPGGGSGTCTLYRPPARCGGLSSGQLARDSSKYELSIRTDGPRAVYQVRLPWSELGGIEPAFGTSFGLSLLLNDNDGAGRAACLSWGDGLVAGWSPTNFGLVTLVDP